MAIQSTYMDSRVSLQGCSPEFSHNLLLSHCKFIIPYLSILKIHYQLSGSLLALICNFHKFWN